MTASLGAARWSVLSNVILVALKLAVGFSTGAVSVLSEAVHSGVDLLAAVIAFFAVRIAARPPDHDHQFGHGKFENISALVEGLLIIVAAGWILYESISELLAQHYISFVLPGVAVMALSAVVNLVVSGHLYKVAGATGSMALEADALHLRTDVYTSVGVLFGLLLVQLTGWQWLDAATAIVVALMILRSAVALIRRAFWPLVDARLSPGEESAIEGVLAQHAGDYLDWHALRTRRAGADRYIDFHLVLHQRMPLGEVHGLCDRLEQALRAALPAVHVLIHPEPCDESCPECAPARL